MRGPATDTDELVLAPDSQILRRDGYDVLVTPTNPRWWEGNRLVLHAAPDPAELDRWLSVWRKELGSRPGLVRVMLTWETGRADPGWPEGAVPAAWHPTPATVLRLGALRQPARPAAVTCRPLAVEAEWADWVAMTVAQIGERWPGQEPFAVWRCGVHRARVVAGGARIWGAFDGRRLVGGAGCYEAVGWARFQQVETRTDARGRGVASALVHAISADVRARRPKVEVIVVAEPGSTAERIYRRLGYEPAGIQWELSAPLAALDAMRRDVY